MLKWSEQTTLQVLVASIAGILLGILDMSFINTIASFFTNSFINLFKLISLPIVFISIISSLGKMENIHDFKKLGASTLKYTLLTTAIASSIAALFYLLIQPASQIESIARAADVSGLSKDLAKYATNIVPNNILSPFIEHNLLSVIFLSLLISICIHNLPSKQKDFFHGITDNIFQLLMQITNVVVYFLPLGIVCFFITAINSINYQADFNSIMLYLICILCANLFQGFVVLPLLLFIKKIPPTKTFKSSTSALLLAFFTKSSTAALPESINIAVNKLNVQPKIAKFIIPICTTINMNACAAFIVTTTLFVSQSSGQELTPFYFLIITIFSVIAAIGNASIPMGCYFMSISFLIAMGIPLDLMTVILPFYIILDMLETAINVWSDICITCIVNKKYDSPEPNAALK